MQARVRACANIALVKYWGKTDTALNVPAVGSISITLGALWSETTVRVASELETDRFVLNGVQDARQSARVSRFLDLLREQAGRSEPMDVTSHNNFPTGAGLASSASGFAALAVAAAGALGLALSDRELGVLARRGSGSAPRSLFGGFVEMHAGQAPDGADSYAEPLAPADHWPLEVVIAITDEAQKAVGSTQGMQRSAASSPYYSAWVRSHPGDLALARQAIEHRDFDALARVSEHSCLKMHAAALASEPPLLYWKAATLECVRRVQALRAEGLPVCFTIDAGPQVKAVCEPAAREAVAEVLAAVPGVSRVLVSTLGNGVERL